MKSGTIYLLFLALFMSSGLLAQNKKKTLPNLNGKWVSREDPGNTLLVKNGWIYESHGKAIDTFRYEISGRNCAPGKWGDKKSFFVRKRNMLNKDIQCYKLLSFSSNAFSIISDGNDTIYRFIRYLKQY